MTIPNLGLDAEQAEALFEPFRGRCGVKFLMHSGRPIHLQRRLR